MKEIKNKSDHKKAIKQLKALATLIEKYEAQHCQVEKPTKAEAEAFRKDQEEYTLDDLESEDVLGDRVLKHDKGIWIARYTPYGKEPDKYQLVFKLGGRIESSRVDKPEKLMPFVPKAVEMRRLIKEF